MNSISNIIQALLKTENVPLLTVHIKLSLSENTSSVKEQSILMVFIQLPDAQMFVIEFYEFSVIGHESHLIWPHSFNMSSPNTITSSKHAGQQSLKAIWLIFFRNKLLSTISGPRMRKGQLKGHITGKETKQCGAVMWWAVTNSSRFFLFFFLFFTRT